MEERKLQNGIKIGVNRSNYKLRIVKIRNNSVKRHPNGKNIQIKEYHLHSIIIKSDVLGIRQMSQWGHGVHYVCVRKH